MEQMRAQGSQCKAREDEEWRYSLIRGEMASPQVLRYTHTSVEKHHHPWGADTHTSVEFTHRPRKGLRRLRTLEQLLDLCDNLGRFPLAIKPSASAM